MIKIPQEDLFFYFFDLAHKEPSKRTNIQDIEKYWPLIKGADFNAKSLYAILHRTVICVKDLRNKGDHHGLDYLRQNIGIWEEAALQQISDFHIPGLTGICWAYTTLGVKPDQRILAQLKEQIIVKLPEFTAPSIITTLWADATLDIPPAADLLTAYEKRINQILEEPNPELQFMIPGIANIFWAAAVFNVIGSDTFSTNLIEKLYKLTKQHDNLTTESQTQVLMASKHFNLPVPNFAWPIDTNASLLRESLWQSLKTAGAVRRPNKYLSEIGMPLDFCLLPDANSIREVLLEVDSRGLFNYRDGKVSGLNGKTLLMTELIYNDHPTSPLVRVPFFTFNDMKRNPNPELQWKNFLSQLENLEPAPYIALPDKGRITLRPIKINLAAKLDTAFSNKGSGPELAA